MAAAASDEQLMSNVSAGDLTALAELVARHRERSVKFCYRMLGDWALAEDLAQEAFVRLCSLSNPYTARARFSTFLLGILKNLCLDELRSQQRWGRMQISYERIVGAGLPAAGETPAQAVERHETIALVRRYLAGLPPDWRAALLLREFEGSPYREIAELMGWTLAKTKVTIHRARRGLAAELGKELADDDGVE